MSMTVTTTGRGALSPTQGAAAGLLGAAALCVTLLTPWTSSWGPRALELVLFALIAGGGAWLAVIDARTHRIPDRILFPLYGTATGLLGGLAIATADPLRLGWAALGGLSLWLVYFLIGLAGGVAFGDVKLAGLIGLYLTWYSWTAPIAATLLAFVLALPHAITVTVRRRGTREIAFGPYMVAGALVVAAALVFGTGIDLSRV